MASALPASGAAVHPLFATSREAVRLLMSNQTSAARAAFFEADGSVLAASLACWLRVVDAAIDPHPEALPEVLEIVWSVQARAGSAPSRAKVPVTGLHPVASQLILADTSFLGASVQGLLGRWMRCAWNLHTAWNAYAAAAKAVETAERDLLLVQTPTPASIVQWNLDQLELTELRSWAQYGEGLCHFLMSLLPPTIATIGSLVGFAGDRAKATALLTASYQSNTCHAPFSALMLVSFMISMVQYNGENEEQFMPVVESILHSMAIRYPESWFFLLMASRKARHDRQLPVAIRLGELAIVRAREGGMPRMATLLHLHTGWCLLFSQSWADAASDFDRLVHRIEFPGGWYHSKIDYITDRTPWTAHQIAALDTKDTRLEYGRLNGPSFYAYLAALSYLHLHLQQEAADHLAAAEPSPSVTFESTSASPDLGPSPDAPRTPSPSPPPLPDDEDDSASSTAATAGTRGHLNRAYWYLQNALSLIDPKKERPLDNYTRRKSLELLARPIEHMSTLLWLDTAELILRWNGALQMSPSQVESVLMRLAALEHSTPPHFTLEHQALVHLYTCSLYRGLGPAHTARAQRAMDALLTFMPQLAISVQVKVEGTLCYVHYEHAMLLLAARSFERARSEAKKARAVTGYDGNQYNVMQVRCHALLRMIKEAAHEHQIRLESQL